MLESEELEMKNIIEARPGEYVIRFYDRMLKCVSETGDAVCGIFNGQLFTARSNAKEYDDIECLSSKLTPKARLEKQIDLLEKAQTIAINDENLEAVAKLSAQILATFSMLDRLNGFIQ